MTFPKLFELLKKSESILLDGTPIACYFDEKGNEVHHELTTIGNGRNRHWNHMVCRLDRAFIN